ncbi:hypothetical protein Acor_65250 [Acrocarpospora corrugata]|uniref:Uncharacterized protein n=1 Tax=Acrocarpospora corrugata TaxID=35763 RepID=A0A5M3W5Y1_9ACTN|nr:hypothetical protein Acor_65250 [Acrocarpospora corrugata]
MPTGRVVTSLRSVTSVSPALGTGQSVTIGFYGTYTGTNASPTLFTLNDVPCTANTARSARLTSPVNGQVFTVLTEVQRLRLH